MIKRIILTLLGLLILVGILGGIKTLQIRRMIAQASNFSPPPQTVTTVEVRAESWESVLPAIGSLSAVRGVTVAAELPGKVVDIAFESGTQVGRGDLLLGQDTTTERAQLPGAEAAADLARLNLDRSRDLLAKRYISQAEYDQAEATYRQARAEVDNIRAAIDKKTVRAPFSGHLGIRLANLGQILREGDEIVTLQALDPVFVDFQVPQQELPSIGIGYPVRVTSDALPGHTSVGKITAINPLVDPTTRNIRIQATLPNPEETLRPGMFVNVSVVLPADRAVTVIPATAVLYAAYSDSVFVVEEKTSDSSEGQGKNLRQQFVRLGEKRGDFIAVDSGLKAGDTVVSTGVFKLRNGQAVTVDNSLSPKFKLNPKPEDQ